MGDTEMHPARFKELKDTLPVKQHYTMEDVSAVVAASLTTRGGIADQRDAARIVREMAREVHAQVSATVNAIR